MNYLKPVLVLWTFPNTLLGVIAGLFGLISGGKCQWRRGCLEFYGGIVAWLLTKTPVGPSTLAMTLGHTILGQTKDGLAIARDHEHVHVRQYERWGIFFIPAYLGCSLYLLLRGRDAYRDNPFEIEAYSTTELGSPDDDQNGTNRQDGQG